MEQILLLIHSNIFYVIVGLIVFFVFLAVLLVWNISRIVKLSKARKKIIGKTQADLVISRDDSSLDNLKQGLSKTRGSLIKRITNAITGKKIDDAILSQLEEILITSDVGVKTSASLIENLKNHPQKSELDKPELVIKENIKNILSIKPPEQNFNYHPYVIMTVGVNGSGKTTTIGKLAKQFTEQGKKVILAAADTFRAAATEQLSIWAERSNSILIKGKENADPASVVFTAIKKAKEENFDIVIADTAGRLHTRIPLMEELKKIKRVISKETNETGPHETLLVLDATNGQNAIIQAREFNNSLGVTDIALTKLDGTAKGGVIIGITNELKIPIRYIGIGEKVSDLCKFDSIQFVEALFA